MNFLFEGSDGHRYMATTAHCFLTEEIERTWGAGKGPLAKDATGKPIGRVVYANMTAPPVYDIAFIRLDPGVKASPRVCYWGGPVGMQSEDLEGLVELKLFGNGMGVGYESFTRTQTLPARTFFVNGVQNPWWIYATGPGFLGDSGAPVLTADGKAIGIFGSVIPHTDHEENRTAQGTVGILRLPPQIRPAEKALGIDLRLATAAQRA